METQCAAMVSSFIYTEPVLVLLPHKASQGEKQRHPTVHQSVHLVDPRESCGLFMKMRNAQLSGFTLLEQIISIDCNRRHSPRKNG